MANKGYTSRLQIENYMLITIDPSFYDQVDEWIGEVEDYIDTETDRSFVADDTASARLFDGDGSHDILIDECTSVTQVKIGDDVIDPSQYLLYPANAQTKSPKVPYTRIKLRDNTFLHGNQNISISGTWGYADEVPKAIARAATVFVAGIIDYAWNNEGKVSSETIGRYSVTYSTDESKNDFDAAKTSLESFTKQTL